MSSEWSIQASNIGKCYNLFEHPADRLKHLLWGPRKGGASYAREFWALKNVDFSVAKGEVVGIVGRNGAGKSTLLQMVCGTLQPTTGTLNVNGRVAALLELGAGFNPDFSGIENIYMNAAILGLSRRQVDDRLQEILAFADIGDFVHQPVKTYSSGMFMRLAFAVATSVEPDILVIDEALSVGDGAFARKSFDRIMRMKESGKTILFCSHSMYQVEALCSRALWIESGTVRMAGSAADVTNAYHTSLNADAVKPAVVASPAIPQSEGIRVAAPEGSGKVHRIYGRTNSQQGRELDLVSGKSDLEITMEFSVDPNLAAPSVAFGFSDANNLTVASVLSGNDAVALRVDSLGHGQVTVKFPRFPLLKGRYSVTAFLACENALHIYEQIDRCVLLNVTQSGLEQGLVTLDHSWQT